ncbi:transposase, partial [bacterium]|nr:transposase [bacterium]
MASQTYHHNKKTGVTYVYSVESYWDKEKKAPRNKQVCLGKLDKATGEIIPSQRKVKAAKKGAPAGGVTAKTRVAGPAMLLDKLSIDTGLASIVKRCFPQLHEEMMSLVYFIVEKGLPLSRSEAWSMGHLHPYGELIASQRISELLLAIREDDRQKFLSLWMAKIAENDYLCYDITSISS